VQIVSALTSNPKVPQIHDPQAGIPSVQSPWRYPPALVVILSYVDCWTQWTVIERVNKQWHRDCIRAGGCEVANLRQLQCFCGRMTPNIMQVALRHHGKARELYVFCDDKSLIHVSAIRWLRTLDLTMSSICGSGLAYVSALTMLRQLNLSRCKHLKECRLRGLDNLEVLILGHCEHMVVCALDSLSSLRLFSLHRCNRLPDLFALRVLPLLTFLDLGGCSMIDDRSMTFLLSYPTLVTLILSECRLVSDTGIQRLAGLPRLEVLNLQHCCKSKTPDYCIVMRSPKYASWTLEIVLTVTKG
jgi:hypothetical protein